MIKTIAVGAALALALAAPANAGDKVRINLNGGAAGNANDLYADIAAAAEEVCRTRPVSGYHNYLGAHVEKSCVRDTIAKTVALMRSPGLMAVHKASSRK